MKTLKFTDELSKLVLSGEKTSTWRLFDDKNLSVGDKLSFINRTTGEEFAQAKILSIREKTLGEIDDRDYDDGHERYESKEKMLEAWQSYYNYTVTMNTAIKLIKFEILNQK